MKGQVDQRLITKVQLFLDMLGVAEEFYSNYIQESLPSEEGTQIYLNIEAAFVWADGWLQEELGERMGE